MVKIAMNEPKKSTQKIKYAVSERIKKVNGNGIYHLIFLDFVVVSRLHTSKQ
jgi:hypothetical protein